MSLFKYCPPERIDILEKLLIRYTPPEDFDDAFDCLPAVQGMYDERANRRRYGAFVEKKYEEWLRTDEAATTPRTLADFASTGVVSFEQYQAHLLERESVHLDYWHKNVRPTLSKTIGILCLCRNGLSPIMWSRYAETHTGFLIEFDDTHPYFAQMGGKVAPEYEIKPVRYSKQRAKWHYVDATDDMDFIFCKSDEWQYEAEVRAVRVLTFGDAGQKDPKGKPTLFAIPPECILSVTLGLSASESLVQRVKRLQSRPRFAKLRVQRAEIHKTDYVINPIPI